MSYVRRILPLFLMLLLSVVLTVSPIACVPAIQIVEVEAHAAATQIATGANDTRPYVIDTVILSSTTDWVLYGVPSWVAQVVIQNVDTGTGVLHVGYFDESGAFVGPSGDDFFTLAVGQSATFYLTSGPAGTADQSHRTFALHSTTASLPASFYVSESAQ